LHGCAAVMGRKLPPPLLLLLHTIPLQGVGHQASVCGARVLCWLVVQAGGGRPAPPHTHLTAGAPPTSLPVCPAAGCGCRSGCREGATAGCGAGAAPAAAGLTVVQPQAAACIAGLGCCCWRLVERGWGCQPLMKCACVRGGCVRT